MSPGFASMLLGVKTNDWLRIGDPTTTGMTLGPWAGGEGEGPPGGGPFGGGGAGLEGGGGGEVWTPSPVSVVGLEVGGGF